MAVRMPVSSSRPTESNTYGRQSHAEQNIAYVYKSFILWPPRQFMVIVISYIRDRSEMATKRANESWVWRHMEKLNGNKAQCTLCSKQLMMCRRQYKRPKASPDIDASRRYIVR